MAVDKKQVILAVDTATEYCSAALQVKDRVYVREQLAPQKHASLILTMIDELLAEASVERSEIELIGFGRGPGSFTGVRIACSVAQGLALGLDRPTFGIDELKMLAVAALKQHQGAQLQDCWIIGSIDARMGEVYYALYHYHNQCLEQVIETSVIAPEQAVARINQVLQEAEIDCSQVLTAGSGIAIMQAHGWQGSVPNQDNVLFPRASTLLDIYAHEECEEWDAAQAEPLYCRNEVTWKKIGEQ